MRKLRVISALLVCVMALTSFVACGKSASSQNVNSGEESIAVGVSDTQPTEEPVKPKKLASELGGFYALQTALSMEYNPYFELDYNAGAEYVPCIVFDGKIYKGARYGGRDYNYQIFDSIEIYDCDTLSLIANIPLENNNDVALDLVFFTYKGRVYFYEDSSYDDTNGLFYITDDYTIEEDVELGTAILGDNYGKLVYDDAACCISNAFEYQNGVVIVASDRYYSSGDETVDVYFLGNDGSMNSVHFDSFCEDFDYIISGFTYGKNLFVLRSTYKYRVVDITTFKEVSAAIPYDVLTSYNIMSGKNGHYLVNTLEGFYEIDPDNSEVYKLIDYNCVLGNVSVLYDSRFLFEKNGDYYFFCCLYPEDRNMYSDSYMIDTEIFRITPCLNPYEDKVVLDLVTDVSDPALIATIKAYNDSGTDYYINYHIYDGTIPDCKIIKNESADKYEAYNSVLYEKYAYSNAMKEKIKLAFLDENSDIDLVYGFGLNEAFDTDKLFMDLSPYLENDGSFTSDNYYTNIIDAKKKESGSLYVLPIAFEINALSNPSDSDNTIKDFTTEDNGILVADYERLLKDSAIMSDPMGSYGSSFECLNELISNESEKIVDLDGGQDVFDESLFSSFVEFSELHSSRDIDIAWADSIDTKYSVDYTNSTSAYDMICFRYTEDEDGINSYDCVEVDYYGIPSSDGRGIAADITNCISVNNLTDEPDASFGFVKYLMENMKLNTYDGQGFMVNRNINDSIQRTVIKSLSEIEYLSYFDIEVPLKKMDTLLSDIDRVRFRDDIITYAYIQPYLDYSNGDISKDELLKIAKESVNDASLGIINSLKD